MRLTGIDVECSLPGKVMGLFKPHISPHHETVKKNAAFFFNERASKGRKRLRPPLWWSLIEALLNISDPLQGVGAHF